MAQTHIPIASQVLSGSTASITFSSIPGTYTDLILRASTRDTNASAGNGSFALIVNGDSASNYSVTRLRAQGTTPSSTKTTSATNAGMGSNSLDTAGNTANTFAISEITIPNYLLTVSRIIVGIESAEDNTSSGNNINNIDAALYRGGSGISSITISASTAFAAGSRFDLYGITHF